MCTGIDARQPKSAGMIPAPAAQGRSIRSAVVDRGITMLYQCTKDMLKALKVEKAEKPDTYNGLFAWNVRIMKIRRRNLVYLMNDATRISVILYGVTAKEFKEFEKNRHKSA